MSVKSFELCASCNANHGRLGRRPGCTASAPRGVCNIAGRERRVAGAAHDLGGEAGALPLMHSGEPVTTA